VVIDKVVVVVATVVVDAAFLAVPKDAVSGVEPRPPETATRARARRTPVASPIPKRFPSIIVCLPAVGR